MGNSPIVQAETMTSIMVAMRVKKSLRMSCMPLTMRWPSCTAGCSAAKESLTKIMSATPRVAWLPLCMAMPRLAFLSESTSLTPSPIIAT